MGREKPRLYVEEEAGEERGCPLSSRRLKQLEKKAKTSKERIESRAYIIIDKMVSGLELPKNIKEEAMGIYKKARKQELTDNRPTKGILATAIYIACRRDNIPRTPDEIADKVDIPRKKIARNYKLLSKKLNIRTHSPNPQAYIRRFCTKLGLDFKVETKAQEILRRAPHKLTNGINPASAAATAIYLASKLCGQRKNLCEVADATGINKVTIRNKGKKWVKELGLEKEINASSK